MHKAPDRAGQRHVFQLYSPAFLGRFGGHDAGKKSKRETADEERLLFLWRHLHHINRKTRISARTTSRTGVRATAIRICFHSVPKPDYDLSPSTTKETKNEQINQYSKP